MTDLSDDLPEAIRHSGLFDPDWYLASYPDVARLSLSPQDHYARFGLAMGRDPGPGFDSAFYLATYSDATQPAFAHYLRVGRQRGNLPSPAENGIFLAPLAPSKIRIGLIRADLVDFILTVEGWAKNAASLQLVIDGRATHPLTLNGTPARFQTTLAVSERDLDAGLYLLADDDAKFPVRPSVPVPEVTAEPLLAGPDARVTGRVDYGGRRMVQGWAEAGGAVVELVLTVDGAPYAVTRSGLARRDLDKGDVGFRFDLPPNLMPCREIVAEVAATRAAGELVRHRRTAAPSGTLLPSRLGTLLRVKPGADDVPASVSVIILNRNGGALLQELFASAQMTGDLAACEWIIVDHQSTDRSEAICSSFGPTVKFLRRNGNFSFSASCNFGAGAAQGEVLLFANNDLILRKPVMPLIRRHLADAECGVLGAKLLDWVEDGRQGPVQHVGVFINPSLSGGVMRPYEARACDETPALTEGATVVPAVTGAFMAMRRQVFDALDGFDEGYLYGMEDIDLCLRLAPLGLEVRCEHGFDIVHHRGYSRGTGGTNSKRRAANYARFNARWGAALRDAVRADTAHWTGSRPVIGILTDDAPRAEAFANALQDIEPCHVRILPATERDISGINTLILADTTDLAELRGVSPFLRLVNWTGDTSLPDCDFTLTDGPRTAARRLPRLAAGPRPLRIAIKCPAPAQGFARWGDYHFAQSLAEAFRRLGHVARVDCREAWQAEIGNADDAVIVLRGLLPYSCKPSQTNILWLISHPHDVPLAELAPYDHVYAASALHAGQLSDQLGREVSFLPQCTDTTRFYFDPERIGTRPDRVLFVGNARGVFRDAVRWSADEGLDIHIYGQGWKPFLDDARLRGSNIPNSVLAEFYASSKVTLCDHWDDMKRLGYVSNRVMDVLAVGGRLAVDEVAGLRDLFPDGYDVFRSAKELRATVEAPQDLSAAAMDARAALAAHVAQEHSFDARAATLLDRITARNDLCRSVISGDFEQ